MSATARRRNPPPRSATAAATRRRWLHRLRVCYRQVQDLLVRRQMFQEFRTLVEGNERLKKADSTFFDWLALNYSDAVVIGVRRQLDRDPRSVSLQLLLEDIAVTPELVSRRSFVSRFRGPRPTDTEAGRDERRQFRQIGNQRFDQLVGKGRRSLTPADVRRDLQRLEAAERTLRRFANKRVAHRDFAALRRLPTFAELHAAIDVLSDIVVRYLHLLGLDEAPRLLPTRQYRWQAIFEFPWAEPKRKGPRP